jgi:Retinoic acid induced 16-like protein
VLPPEGTVPTLLSADDPSTTPSFDHPEYERTDSPAFLDALDNFLRYLGFWQDVLEHCTSTRIKVSLLDTFQSLFLRQLLYPSLLESSERDSVAILTYLRIILEVLEHPDLAHLMLSYLMGESSSPTQTRPKTTLRRKSTMTLLRTLPSTDALSTPQLFSMADLILGNLKSKREDRVIATLRLVSTLLKRHCGYTVNTLLRTTAHPVSEVTIGHHEREMELFMGLVSPYGLQGEGSQSYVAYVQDAYNNLEMHPCSVNFLHNLVPTETGNSHSVTYHTIRQDDPLMKGLLRSFANFFTNCVELNLWLTRVIIDLYSCRFRSMEGWLLFKPEDGYIGDDPGTFIPENHTQSLDSLLAEFSSLTMLSDSDSDWSDDVDTDPTTSYSASLAKRKPTFTRFPQLFTMLKTLKAQISHYQSELPEETFSTLLTERRAALTFLEGISSAMQPHRPPERSNSVSSVGSRGSRGEGIPTVGNVTPFSEHFERTKRLIQPLFPMGTEVSGPNSPEDSLADLREVEVGVEVKRRTGEFEPPDEITLGRLLNNIIVFEEFIKEVMALIQCRRILFEPVKHF